MAEARSLTSQVSNEPSASVLSLEQVFVVILEYKKQILLLSVISGIVALGLNYLLPNYYKATATLLPETEKGKLLSLGQFSDVAQKLLGDNIPGSEIARLYPTVMTSQTILRNVIDRRYQTEKFAQPVDLVEYFELSEPTREENISDLIQKKFKSIMSASTDAKTGIVTITIEMREPQLAADVANAVIAELDDFMRKKKKGNASEQLKWIEVRLKQVEGDLTNSEESLKAFREKNRRVLDSPQLLLEQERKVRQVQVNSTVFVELKKQSELAKLEEIKNLTIVNVLDPARPPAIKEGPKRKTNAGICFLLVFIGSSAYFVVMANYGDKMRAFKQTLAKGRGKDTQEKR